MASFDIPIGTLAEATAGSSTVRGVVKFCGPTAFQPGRWVGMELSEPRGKNDGSVAGRRYFTCKMNYGIFVKFSQVKIIEAAPSGPSSAKPSRPTSVQLSRNATGTPVTKSSQTKTVQSPEPAEKHPPQTPQRSGTTRVQPSTARTPLVIPKPATPVRLDSPVEESPIQPPVRSAPSPQLPSPKIPSPSLPRPRVTSTTSLSEEQELRTKIRTLEARRADDVRHIRELETRLADAEAFVSLRPRLQAKLNQLQQDSLQTRRELQDQATELQAAEARLVQASEDLEMAILDKEMEKEKAEAAEQELDDMKEQLAVCQVELNVLKEHGAASGKPGDASDGKFTLAYIQLERQNERLKEALVRLRDLSQEAEQDQRRRIADLEKELAASEEMQSEFDTTLQRLANADVQIDSLKQQLDDAMGAEDMLVQLTERNLLLGEKIEEMRVVIEDLEALKDLNDELEENHIETEKALQEDIEAKEAQLREASRKIGDLEEAVLDYDQTINQFRELATQLTSELDTLRAEHRNAQSVSEIAATQTATVMSLNLKLQSTAAKSQAKTIELELQNLKTRQANELLSIIQPYLPQIYVESDGDSTNTYLLFKRMAAKADLLNVTLAERYSLPESLNGHVTEPLIGICEMRGRIAALSILCKRFASTLRRCEPNTFLTIGRIYSEINPLERRLDTHIDLLKREEFRSLECVTDVTKISNQFEHLSELYLPGTDFDLGERELGLALSLDHDIDFFASAMAWTKTSLLEIFKDDDIDNELGDEELEVELIAPLQKILDQCRNVRTVARKLVKRVEDLTNDSSALKPIFVPRLSHLTGPQGLMELALKFGVQLAQQVRLYVIEVKEKKDALKLTRILASVRSSAGEIKAGGGTGSWQTAGELLSQLQREAADVLSLATESDSVMKITGTAPWVLRVDEIKSMAAVNVDAERKIVQLNEEMQELVRGIKNRDQTINEGVVKIQLMERRAEGSKRQADALTDLEDQLSKAKKQEKAYEEAMEQLQTDLDALEQENGRLKQSLSAPDRQTSGMPQNIDYELGAPIEGNNLEASHLLEQIESLRGAVRFLRTENGYLKGQDLLKEIQSLPSLGPAPYGHTPQLPYVTADGADEIDSDDPLKTGGHAVHTKGKNGDDQPRLNKEEAAGGVHAKGEKASSSSLQALSTESKVLYRELLEYSASAKLIDLEALERERNQGWMPQRKTTAYQLWERKREGDRLKKQVQGLRLHTARLVRIGG